MVQEKEEESTRLLALCCNGVKMVDQHKKTWNLYLLLEWFQVYFIILQPMILQVFMEADCIFTWDER